MCEHTHNDPVRDSGEDKDYFSPRVLKGNK